MKILFLEIETERDWALASVGPGFLAAYLRLHGHEANILRVGLDQHIPELIDSITDISPNIIGLSLTTRQWQRAAAIVAEIKAVVNIPIIAGGLHPTFAPELRLLEDFDYLCIGEGEEALCQLLSCLEQGNAPQVEKIANIWVKGAERPKLRPPVANLDTLPFIARDFLNERNGVIHMFTQRGCPFPCSYCAAGAIDNLYENGYIRRRSVTDVICELKFILDQAPINYVIFLDDTFTINHSWVEEFCCHYAKEISVPFTIQSRVETIHPDLLGQLAAAGCSHVVYGVESGSVRVRRDIMNRSMTNHQITEAFKWTKQAGMMVTANYMIGLPGERVEDIEQTLALNAELDPDDFGCAVFYPYPGTPLFQFCQDEKYLPENWNDLPANNRQSILNLPDISKEEIESYYKRFSTIREQTYLKRYGGSFTNEQKDIIKSSFEDCAAGG